jgi:hypothetical protein
MLWGYHYIDGTHRSSTWCTPSVTATLASRDGFTSSENMCAGRSGGGAGGATAVGRAAVAGGTAAGAEGACCVGCGVSTVFARWTSVGPQGRGVLFLCLGTPVASQAEGGWGTWAIATEMETKWRRKSWEWVRGWGGVSHGPLRSRFFIRKPELRPPPAYPGIRIKRRPTNSAIRGRLSLAVP